MSFASDPPSESPEYLPAGVSLSTHRTASCFEAIARMALVCLCVLYLAGCKGDAPADEADAEDEIETVEADVASTEARDADSSAQDDEEASDEDEESEDAESADEDEDGADDAPAPLLPALKVAEGCTPAPLTSRQRASLIDHVQETYGWIKQPVLADTVQGCPLEGTDGIEVELEFEPHFRAPRYDRYWGLDCGRFGTQWKCRLDELTRVYLTREQPGVRVFDDVTPDQAIEAIAAIVVQSRESGIANPFEPGTKLDPIDVDAIQFVSREEFCSDYLVTARLSEAESSLQLCVERPPCDGAYCPLKAWLQGTTD